jgi:CRP-like cAMP-binding protein
MGTEKLSEEQLADARENLRQCLLFSGLGEEPFGKILSRTRSMTLEENATLFEQQQAPKDIFLLDTGQIKLALVSAVGHEKVIDLISPGGFFAEAIMFAGRPVYPVTATALLRSQVWGTDAVTYEEILRQSTDACFAIMAQMSRRLHWHIAKIDRLTLHNAAFRVVAYLLDQMPGAHLASAEIRLDTPKHVIASRLSISPETLSRTFARLGCDGYVEVADNSIRVPDIEKLRAFVRTGEGRSRPGMTPCLQIMVCHWQQVSDSHDRSATSATTMTQHGRRI